MDMDEERRAYRAWLEMRIRAGYSIPAGITGEPVTGSGGGAHRDCGCPAWEYCAHRAAQPGALLDVTALGEADRVSIPGPPEYDDPPGPGVRVHIGWEHGEASRYSVTSIATGRVHPSSCGCAVCAWVRRAHFPAAPGPGSAAGVTGHPVTAAPEPAEPAPLSLEAETAALIGVPLGWPDETKLPHWDTAPDGACVNCHREPVITGTRVAGQPGLLCVYCDALRGLSTDAGSAQIRPERSHALPRRLAVFFAVAVAFWICVILIMAGVL